LIGNAGKNIPGALTTAIKNNPACLLLLDEIEKSPAAVFNLFLSLLDEGRITDAFGKSISASHVFVIATSNAGSEYIREAVQKETDKETLQKKVLDYVMEHRVFTPEFLNRFDGVVVYEPLSEIQLQEVAKRLLVYVARDLKNKGIIVDFDNSVYEKVVKDGYDPALGARPMRRMIELKLGDVLAKGILSNQIEEGDHIKVVADSSLAGFAWSKM
jgi:ATP-dependent Clp protease ATP-binding subunit ClpA